MPHIRTRPHVFRAPPPPFIRRLQETSAEILKVSERPSLIAYNEVLRWQLVLRKPYLDPVNVMQVFKQIGVLLYHLPSKAAIVKAHIWKVYICLNENIDSN